jgi:hypothetical protein
MPTRSEIDSIGERLQALRREVRALGGQGGSAARLDALEQELAALRGERARPQPAAAPPGQGPAGRAPKPTPARSPARTRKARPS